MKNTAGKYATEIQVYIHRNRKQLTNMIAMQPVSDQFQTDNNLSAGQKAMLLKPESCTFAILQLPQKIHSLIWTNRICNLDKYMF